MKPSDFAIRLTQFFSAYLPAQRDLSPNTIKAYRDAFTLLLRYCRDQRALPPEQVTLDALDVPLLLAFLDYLQSARQCCARTRNHRLSALHAFFRYLQTEEPDRILRCQQILAIPLQHSAPPPVHYLSREELTALLFQPNLTTNQGRRDAVLLSLLYDSGARVQEMVDTCVRDVRLEAPAQIQLTGKGRKMRIVPLLSNTVELLKRVSVRAPLEQRRPRTFAPLLQPTRRTLVALRHPLHTGQVCTTGAQRCSAWVDQDHSPLPSPLQGNAPSSGR
jgi:site-specific recombinase XerD